MIFSDYSNLAKIVREALASGQVVQAVPNENISTLGLNPSFSYQVINLNSKGNFELRNSWGTL